eukprot:gnl/TRDRNA2_/TRDRNA2_29976_c0_seq2.p1 gnl/TRDRNA2_/TRDRNA2_29976_c0~~gnl/TRDRNA2_/TRDRNA2_29976_c0_seq2.p1  ORF type:complete len:330 (+),score=64.78 gnl/TRDRNA2_/TRDRNA2_29976_c0_seq2:84-1073(+)
MVMLALVFNKNSFSFDGPTGLRMELIFPMITRANHSCAPNAVIVPTDRPDESSLKALRAISPGEPVEICYFQEPCLLRTAKQRQDIIQAGWTFVCRCGRCEAAIDNTRRFAVDCTACKQRDFAVMPDDSLQCIACGATRDAKAVPTNEDLLKEEEEVEGLLETLPNPQALTPYHLVGLQPCEETWPPEALERCKRFATAHPEHHVAAETLRSEAAAAHELGKRDIAAAAQAAYVAAAKRHLPEGLCGLSWLADMCCRLAYLLEAAERRDEAIAALDEMLANYEVVYGQRPPVMAMKGLLQCPVWDGLLAEAGPKLESGRRHLVFSVPEE